MVTLLEIMFVIGSPTYDPSKMYKNTAVLKYKNGPSLIKNAGNSVVKDLRAKAIKLSPHLARNLANASFRTSINHRTKADNHESFNRLGFEISHDADFNPHYEYNMRKAPKRLKLNNSVELKKSTDSGQNGLPSLINQVEHSRMKVLK